MCVQHGDTQELLGDGSQEESGEASNNHLCGLIHNWCIIYKNTCTGIVIIIIVIMYVLFFLSVQEVLSAHSQL